VGGYLSPPTPDEASEVLDLASEELRGLIFHALAEDLGQGDLTTRVTIPQGIQARGTFQSKQRLVVAGLPIAQKVFEVLDPSLEWQEGVEDGTEVGPGTPLASLRGVAGPLLAGERVALNFLQHLSGIATLTHRFVEQIAGTRAKMRDTRKTTPGLRLLEKYAVRMGGATNHRIGLFDAILLKENHIALAGGVKAALDQAHSYVSSQMTPRALTAYEAVGMAPSEAEASSLSVQIEVRNETELCEALAAGAEAVLLDNMTPNEARHCVGIVRQIRPECVVEISGGITLANVRAYAETDADYLSSGALTHSAPNADLSLLVDRIE
jgi:nicotinate-nucleotide pyrophosphorylase (carboxylating)